MGLPKLVLSDIDGVWTDGGMYYDQLGNEFKKFNTSDSAGILFLQELNIPIGIITGEDTKIVQNRAQKLKVDFLFQGAKDKFKIATELCLRLKIEMKEVAFIGDDIGDLKLLKSVGFSCAPQNASDYIQKEVDYVTAKKGGDGAFREFVEHMLLKENKLETVLNAIIYEK